MYRRCAKDNPSDLLQQLVDSTGAWLHYKFLCMCDPLFNESYLSHPLGSFLLSRYPDPYRIQAQYPHPAFEPYNERRPVDFAVVTAEDKLEVAIETKWLTLHQPSHALSRVFADLIKLALLSCENAFFMMAGPSRAILQLLQDETFRNVPGHLYGDTQICGLLPVVKDHCGDCRYTVLPVAEIADGTYFKTIKEKRVFANVAVPKEIKLAAMPPYSGLRTIPGCAYDVYGWQVQPMSRNETIRL